MELVDLMPIASVALYFLSGAAAGAALTYTLCGKGGSLSSPDSPDMPGKLQKLQSATSIPTDILSREGSFSIPALVREGSKIPLLGGSQLEADVKSLQKSLANLQGTSRALHQLERHHEGLKQHLEQYKAAVQESTARRDLGAFKRLETLEEQQAALKSAWEEVQQGSGSSTSPSGSQQHTDLQAKLDQLSEQCTALAAQHACLQADMQALQDASTARVSESMQAQQAVLSALEAATSIGAGSATLCEPIVPPQIGERLEVLELLCERMAHHVLGSSKGRMVA